MKDRQNPTTGTQPSIPILSPALHWIAMPAIVFLRSGFGYAFLSPKTVFLAFAQVSILFLIVTWVEPWLRRPLWAVALFAASASTLYVAHLLAAFWREKERKGKHDYYAGTSHLLRIPAFSQNPSNQDIETVLHLWIEPAVVFVIAVFFRGFLEEQWLSLWLLMVALGMWLKAFINYWYGIRSEKKHHDIIEDAEEKMPRAGGFADVPLPGAGNRKPKRDWSKQATEVEAEMHAKEQRFAEVLRLMPPRPPYDLEQAERNYRDLMKAFHPDPNSPTPENNEKAAALNEAIAYFRTHHTQI